MGGISVISHTHCDTHDDSQEDPIPNLSVFALEMFYHKVKQKCLNGVGHRFGIFA